MKRIMVLVFCIAVILFIGNGGKRLSMESEENKANAMKVTINESNFTATLESNSATEMLLEILKNKEIIMRMEDYGGFEKVGSLDQDLPTSNRQITTSSGDIVLYNGNQIVIFYGSNTWNYTKIGSMDHLDGFVEALGDGDVTVTFSM